MSYMNQHMDAPIEGIRGSVQNHTALDNILHGTTWANFHERHVSNHEYGSTKFNDLVVIAYYFKHRFNALQAAGAIGYACAFAEPKSNAHGYSVIFRLKRINMISTLTMLRALVKWHLITLDDIRHILSDPLNPPKGQHGQPPWKSDVYKWYAKRIVLEAIHKWGGQHKAAEKLNVQLIVVQYWAALDTVDPMIRATQQNG